MCAEPNRQNLHHGKVHGQLQKNMVLITSGGQLLKSMKMVEVFERHMKTSRSLLASERMCISTGVQSAGFGFQMTSAAFI